MPRCSSDQRLSQRPRRPHRRLRGHLRRFLLPLPRELCRPPLPRRLRRCSIRSSQWQGMRPSPPAQPVRAGAVERIRAVLNRSRKGPSAACAQRATEMCTQATKAG